MFTYIVESYLGGITFMVSSNPGFIFAKIKALFTNQKEFFPKPVFFQNLDV